MSDSTLILKQIKAGNKRAFRWLFDEYYRSLCAFASRYISEDAVCNDVVQDVFLALWENREGFINHKALKTYLFNSVRNQCLNILRHEKVKQKNMTELIDVTLERYLEHSIIEEEVYNEIHKAVKDLSSQAREIVIQSMNGKSNQEIADELQISINTVKTFKKRAYRILREKLSGIQWLLFVLLS